MKGFGKKGGGSKIKSPVKMTGSKVIGRKLGGRR